jgi:hypothetical protein
MKKGGSTATYSVLPCSPTRHRSHWSPYSPRATGGRCFGKRPCHNFSSGRRLPSPMMKRPKLFKATVVPQISQKTSGASGFPSRISPPWPKPRRFPTLARFDEVPATILQGANRASGEHRREALCRNLRSQSATLCVLGLTEELSQGRVTRLVTALRPGRRLPER